jgi:hypothetical protein
LLAWPLACLALILVGVTTNIPVAQWPWAFPGGWSGASAAMIPLASMAVVIGTALLFCGFALTYRSGQGILFLEWVVLHLLIFCSVWMLIPAGLPQTAFYLLGAVLVSGTALLLYRSRVYWPATCERYLVSRADAASDVLFIFGPLAAGYWAASGMPYIPDTSKMWSALLLYPLYAFFQLGIFLAIPALRMRKLGYSTARISMICAIVFSLVHWPNPLLMLMTGVAMLAWSRQFLRGRNLLVLALVMGLAATGLKFMLPQDWTLDLRIGPDYIDKRAGQ